MISIPKGPRAGIAGAALAAMLAVAAAPAAVAQDDYAQSAFVWTPAPAEVGVGDGVRIAVRLDGPSGLVALEPDAVSEIRLDMAPDGMAGMAAPLRSVEPAEGESLAWETDLAMVGRWGLTLTADVPGEAEPVTGDVIFTAAKDAAE